MISHDVGLRAAAVAVLLASMVLSLSIASTANASNYCGVPLGDHGSCQGPYQALTKNAAWAQNASWKTCAGAKTSTGAFYGQYFCASDYSCHTYGGGNLYAMAHNHESFGQTVYGFTNENVNVTCPRGGPVSLAATLGTGTLRSYASGDLTCLEVSDGFVGNGITCAATTRVNKFGLAGALVPADSTGTETGTGTLYALAPKGAVSAAVGDRTVAVVDGAIQTTLPTNASVIRWTPSGSTVSDPRP